jgi:hypothetical protein
MLRGRVRVALRRPHHRAYDRGELDLLPPPGAAGDGPRRPTPRAAPDAAASDPAAGRRGAVKVRLTQIHPGDIVRVDDGLSYHAIAVAKERGRLRVCALGHEIPSTVKAARIVDRLAPCAEPFGTARHAGTLTGRVATDGPCVSRAVTRPASVARCNVSSSRSCCLPTRPDSAIVRRTPQVSPTARFAGGKDRCPYKCPLLLHSFDRRRRHASGARGMLAKHLHRTSEKARRTVTAWCSAFPSPSIQEVRRNGRVVEGLP